MRILVISNLYPPHVHGGYELLCAQIAEYAVTRGHQVTVLTSTDAAGPRTEECAGVRIERRLALAPPFGQAAIRSRRYALRVGTANAELVRQAIASGQPDVIAMWSQLRLTSGPSHAAYASRRPLAWVLNDLNWLSLAPRSFTCSPIGLLRALLDRTVHRRATLAGIPFTTATAISGLVRDGLVQGGLPTGAAQIIHQGIRLQSFPLGNGSGQLHDPPRVLYVGALLEQKGVHTLAEALRSLHRDGVHLSLTLAGDGDAAYTNKLRHILADIPGVNWLGRVPHEAVGAIYRDHDLLVFPSLYREGFGLTFLEAMASGLPVIASDTGGHAECLKHGDNSLIFPAGNAEVLADCLRQLCSDGDVRMRLAHTGRRFVEEGFTIERYADALLKFYALAVDRHARTVITTG